jgi:hypothetical protein
MGAYVYQKHSTWKQGLENSSAPFWLRTSVENVS